MVLEIRFKFNYVFVNDAKLHQGHLIYHFLFRKLLDIDMALNNMTLKSIL